MRFDRIMLLWVASQCLSNANAKTLMQMQNLYKEIGNDLMNIRKEFAAAQPKVYSVLDRVDKMYNLAKSTAEKKHQLKETLKNQGSESKKLYDEINALKTKVSVTESELIKTHKKLDDASKELQSEKTIASQLSSEKSKLSKEQSELQSHLKKLKSEKNKDQTPSNRELMREIKSLEGLSEEDKALLKQAQSLSLSSTSAPSSPR